MRRKARFCWIANGGNGEGFPYGPAAPPIAQVTAARSHSFSVSVALCVWRTMPQLWWTPIPR